MPRNRGPNEQGTTVSSFQLKEEADAKTPALARAEAAEQRVKELEGKLEEALARRSWWRRIRAALFGDH